MKDKGISILLVEDDEIDVMNVKRAFKKCNIVNPLFVAENGLDALAKLRGDGEDKIIPAPKIILLDINMPKMNGIEFLHELRTDPDLKAISVVVLTISNEERDKVDAYNLNVAGYILKPVEPAKFIETIHALDVYWNLIELP